MDLDMVLLNHREEPVMNIVTIIRIVVLVVFLYVAVERLVNRDKDED